MTKATKANFLKSSWILVSIFLFCCLIACGGSPDSDTTTDSGVQIASFAGSPTALESGRSSILTVKITDSSGKAVSGVTVTFSFTINRSGGTVVALNGGTTDAGGTAIGVYTAGSTTPALALDDAIQATCGSAASGLIITRLATTDYTTGYQVALSASVNSLLAGESSVITATVTSAGTAAPSIPVAFSFISNGSGATLNTLGSVTDGSGKIIAVYKAGTTSPTADVQDTIQVNVNSGDAFGALIISRAGSASSSAVTPGYKMTVFADVTSLAAGQSSIITATVTDSSGNAQQGLTVDFSFVGISPSGGSVTALNSGLTDASGTAVAVYTAGATSPTAVVQDTVQALVDSGGYSSSGAVVITRTAASTSTPGYQMNLTASTASVVAGGSSIITATVTNGSGNPVVGMAVNFSFVTTPPSGATFAILGTGTTDASGKAIAIYTAGGTNPTADVQDTFQAEVDDSTYSAYGAVLLTRTGSASTTTIPAGYILTLTAPLSSLPAGGHSVLTAKVTDGAGNPVSGMAVTFAIPSNSSSATLNSAAPPAIVTTDAAGRAVTTYTAGSTNPTLTVYDAVTATASGAADAVVITRTASGYTPTGNVITVTPTPVSLVARALSAVVAQVSDASGNPVVGETVTFALEVDNSGALLSPLTATTDGSGKAFSIYTAGELSPALQIDDAVSASVTGASGAALITRLPAAGTGKRIFSFIQDPVTSKTTPIAPPWNQVQMKVKVTTDNGTTPVTNEEVSFSIILGEGTIIDAALNTAQEGDPALTVLTDNNGEAYVYFERPSEIGLGDTVVRAQIEGTTYGGDAASIVYWRGFTPTITLEASATTVVAGGSSTLTATLTDGNGNAIMGETVTFNVDVDPSGPSLIVINGTTGGDGRAVATYTAGTTAPSMDSVSASATVMGLDTADAVTITVTAPTP